MKKYLLAALLAIGTTSFGALGTGTDSLAVLPIYSTGQIIEGDSGLLIEATTGNSKNRLEIDFGHLPIPKNADESGVDGFLGEFTVKRANNSAVIDGETYTGAEIKIGPNYNPDILVTEKSVKVKEGVTVKYTVQPFYDGSEENGIVDILRGTISASVLVSKTATAGTFIDSTQNIFVTVSKAGGQPAGL